MAYTDTENEEKDIREKIKELAVLALQRSRVNGYGEMPIPSPDLSSSNIRRFLRDFFNPDPQE